MYTQEELEAKSDFEINKLLAEKDLADISNLDRATESAVEIMFTNGQLSIKDYCNSWADMGPIAYANCISLTFNPDIKLSLATSGNEIGYLHKNPLRAAAIVYLLME